METIHAFGSFNTNMLDKKSQVTSDHKVFEARRFTYRLPELPGDF